MTADSLQRAQGSRLKALGNCLQPPASSLEPRRGQASLEMAIAMGGVILLIFGSLKVYIWVNERLISRQQYYEATRVTAGNAPAGAAPVWDDSASRIRLDMFQGD